MNVGQLAKVNRIYSSVTTTIKEGDVSSVLLFFILEKIRENV